MDLSHASLLVFGLAAVAAGILASVSLWPEFGPGGSASFIIVVGLLPLLCGWLARERWRAQKLEDQIKRHQVNLGSAIGPFWCGDNTPAGLLIVSPDLRICFASPTYLRGTQQDTQEVLGWKILDVMSADRLEDQAKSLLRRADPAASCCFDTVVRTGLTDERPVHITLARIAPWRGEDRVLIVIENLLPGSSSRSNPPLEGYVC